MVVQLPWRRVVLLSLLLQTHMCRMPGMWGVLSVRDLVSLWIPLLVETEFFHFRHGVVSEWLRRVLCLSSELAYLLCRCTIGWREEGHEGQKDLVLWGRERSVSHVPCKGCRGDRCSTGHVCWRVLLTRSLVVVQKALQWLPGGRSCEVFE